MRQSHDGFAVVNEQLRVALSRRAALKTLAWCGAGFAALQAMPFATVPLSLCTAAQARWHDQDRQLHQHRYPRSSQYDQHCCHSHPQQHL